MNSIEFILSRERKVWGLKSRISPSSTLRNFSVSILITYPINLIEFIIEEGPATFSVINSQSRKTQAMSLGDMMRHMNAENEAGGRPTDPYNLLSFEFSRYST